LATVPLRHIENGYWSFPFHLLTKGGTKLLWKQLQVLPHDEQSDEALLFVIYFYANRGSGERLKE
jgi:hypothetical protein